MLVFGSIWFIFMTVWDMGLIMKYPEFLEMSSWMRTVPFGMSIFFNTYYYIGVVSELWKLWKGQRSWGESVSEIIFGYLLWINTPGAIISTLYMIFIPIYTDDLFGTTS